jgi:hypothetical protein
MATKSELEGHNLQLSERLYTAQGEIERLTRELALSKANAQRLWEHLERKGGWS